MVESRLKRYVVYAAVGAYILYRGRWLFGAFAISIGIGWWATRYPEQLQELAVAAASVVAVVSGVAIVAAVFLIVFGALTLRFGVDVVPKVLEDSEF